jgi:hypothetical protein
VTVGRNVVLDAGAGTDDVTIDTLAADQVNATFGAGNDSLSVTGVTANRIRADGGAGNDSLIDGGGNTAASIQFPSFNLV